jgi:subtilisin family serine protease
MSRRSAHSPAPKSPLSIRLTLELLEDRSTPNATTVPAFDNLQLDLGAYSPDHILVHTETAGGKSAASLTGAVNLGFGLYSVALPPGINVPQALSVYSSLPGVDLVTPDYAVSADVIPNDPSFNALWGMNNVGQSGGTAGADIDATAAWNVTTGTGRTIVAVIDTGMDYNHPDLYLNVWINEADIPAAVRAQLIDTNGDGIISFRDLNDPRNIGPGKITDLNGDGRIDAGDILMPMAQGGWSTGPSDDLIGWDYANNDNNPMDDNGHGTHVTGTIGAVGNNGIGVAGVDWNVQIMPLKFLGADGSGFLSGAVSALYYAVAHGARVSNNSYGGATYYAGMAMAIADARAAGHIVVAAAGNSGGNNDVSPSYPASYNYDNVLAVAATDRNNQLASFSNYGSTVELAAPGVSILSTTPNSSYAYYSGTSMATPHVTGAVALLWDLHPDWSYGQVINRILSAVDPLPSLAGKVATGGRLDVGRAIVGSGPTPAPGTTPIPSPGTTPTPSPPPAVTPTPVAPEYTYTSPNRPALIPDRGWIVSPILIDQDMTIQNLRVQVAIAHPRDGDLIVALRSPAGTWLPLVWQRGGLGQNFVFTTFDDAAGRSIASGSAPFRGAYRPELPLSSLAGQNTRGYWYLAVIDTVRGGAGVLASWSLTTQSAPAMGMVESTTVTSGNTLVAGVWPAAHPTSDEFIAAPPVAQRKARLVTAEGGEMLRPTDADGSQVKADELTSGANTTDEPSWLRPELPRATD